MVFCVGFWSLMMRKALGTWNGAPDPDGGAYSAPPYPLVECLGSLIACRNYAY